MTDPFRHAVHLAPMYLGRATDMTAILLRGIRAWFTPVRIAVLAAPLGVALTYAAVARLPERVMERAIVGDLERRAELWQRRVIAGIGEGADVFISAPMTAADNTFLAAISRISDIYHMKLIGADGRVFWSPRIEDLETAIAVPAYRQIALQGQARVTILRKSGDTIPDLSLYSLDTRGERIIGEVLMPVIHTGRVVGVVEYRTDLTDEWRLLLWQVRLMLGTVCGLGLLAAMAASFWLLRNAARRETELRARAERDTEAMAQQVRLSREVQLLGDLNEWLQSAASLPELFDMVSRFMSHLLPFSQGAIYVYSNSRDVLDGWVAWNGCELHDHIRPDSCWGLRRGRTYTFGSGEVNFACGHVHKDQGRPYYCFPILAHGETVGLMHLRAAPGESVADFRSSQKLAQMTAEQISMAIANVRMRDQLREQSVRDPLTGLFNRRHMTDVLRRFIERARRDGVPVAVLSLDVDHFKKFNDNHGHDAGDMVLRAVGEVLEAAVSGDEVACRPGGEEFAIILPGCDSEAAAPRAEAIRAAIEAQRVRYADGDLPRITASIGVAAAPRDGLMVQDLLKVSDEALYAAKAAGRNRVMVAGEAAPARRQGPKPTGIAAE